MNGAKVRLLSPALALAVTLGGCGSSGAPAPSPTASSTSSAAVTASAMPAPQPSPIPSPPAQPITASSPGAAAPDRATVADAPKPCAEVPRHGRDFPVKPVTAPPPFGSLIAPGTTRMGVKLLSGRVFCVNTYGMAQLSDFRLTPDQRFIGFAWTGYEADGFRVIDRTGRGSVTETGVRPVWSPSRNRFAAAQISEAGFGGLEGIGVWEVLASGVRRFVTVENEAPPGSLWRVRRWVGENCLILSMLPIDRDNGPFKRLELRLKGKAWMLDEIPDEASGCESAAGGDDAKPPAKPRSAKHHRP